jgi:putative DNA primase/helicase
MQSHPQQSQDRCSDSHTTSVGRGRRAAQPQADLSYASGVPALEELQARPQWVCWRKEQRKGKLTKVPYSAITGSKAASDNPQTWATSAQAIHALHTGNYDGIGYVFDRDYTGIDLDHCVNPDGSIDSWAQAYLVRLPSYAEYSPTHTGIHILLRGTVPGGIRRRYFTVTGEHVEGTPTTIEACPALASMHATLIAPKPPQPTRKRPVTPAGDSSTSDEALLEKAMHAKNGATFRALWQGDMSGYLSQSEAELALCNLLAFWTSRDASRMDRLFRLSALYREKWDQPARNFPRKRPRPNGDSTRTHHRKAKPNRSTTSGSNS